MSAWTCCVCREEIDQLGPYLERHMGWSDARRGETWDQRVHDDDECWPHADVDEGWRRYVDYMTLDL